MAGSAKNEAESRKQLMALMTRHQRRIFSYIYTLVPRRSDADDILQETSLVICEKFDEFEEGTDFVAWACQIAYWRVRYARQKFARGKVLFNQDVLEQAPLSNSYSMVAWRADSDKLGSRPVHIGWNRNPAEGPVGALRTDFSGGHAMGTTPLRDGRWHHVSVIFVTGDDPEAPVQVKQYVDGRLESNTVTPGPKRSIAGNFKPDETPAAGDILWLGCRLGGSGPKRERFVGSIDELVIADRSLEPGEVVRLMDGQDLATLNFSLPHPASATYSSR